MSRGDMELMTKSTGPGVMGTGLGPLSGSPSCNTQASHCPALGSSYVNTGIPRSHRENYFIHL